MNSNTIGNFNLGISPFSSEILNNTKLIYMIHPNDKLINFVNFFLKYKSKNEKPVIIYQGTHLIDQNILIDYFVPGKIFFEKEGSYYNIENKCQKTSKIFNVFNNINNREDLYILQILNKFLDSNYFNLLISELIPSFCSTKNINNLNFFKEIKIHKTFLKPIIEDFYLNNIISRNSVIMGKCSNVNKKFFKIQISTKIRKYLY